jgi:hypothetical protein
MQKIKCSACGNEVGTEVGCPACGHPALNGFARKGGVKPPPPPEVVNWVITPTPPEMLERMRREFDEAQYLAAVRELERTGGVPIDDLIEGLKREPHGES